MCLQRKDLLRSGSAGRVDQHQRLHRPYARIAATYAFPAALVNQPGRRDLDQAVFRQEMRHRSQAFRHGNPFNLRILLRQDEGIPEETARAPDLGRLRQLVLADGDDHVPHLRRGIRFRPDGFLHRLADMAVVQYRRIVPGQPEVDGQHDVPAFPLPLEPGIPVGIAALRGRENDLAPVQKVETLDRLDQFADLPAVGADVLDRRGTDFTGNQGQVLRSPQAL